MYAYEKLMREHNLEFSELPSDAKDAIEEMPKIEAIIERKKQNGEVVSPSTINKLRLNDKFIVREILDYIDDLEEEEDQQQSLNTDPKGVKIEAELKAMYDNDFRTLTAEKLSNVAPISYDVILQGYEEGGKNGIKTSAYSLIESEKEVFKVTKN